MLIVNGAASTTPGSAPTRLALAQSTGIPADGLEKPRGRSFGRGPSIAELTRLIAALERRR